jgi:hypothetical protein
MTLRLRLRERRAVTHVCRGCEAQRAWFRSRGVTTWDRYHALCFRCYGRHIAGLRAAAPLATLSTGPKLPKLRHPAVA